MITMNRFYHKDSLFDQRKLFLECFPETINSKINTTEHYFWKFHSNFKDLDSREYESRMNKKIVGYYAAIKQQYLIKNKLVTIGLICDVMTSINARGKGVFAKLGEFSTNELKKERFDITIGFPIRSEVIPGHLKVGWKIMFKLPIYVYTIKLDGLLINYKLKALIPIANFINFIRNKIYKTNNHYNFETSTYLSNEINMIIGLDEFYKNWNIEIPITLKKDIPFLEWRLSAPGQIYHIVVLKNKNKDKIVGILIAKEFIKNNILCMGILDLCILKEFYDHTNILLNKLIELSKTSKCEIILVMISKYWKNKYRLNKFGFLKSTNHFTFITKRLSDKTTDTLLKKESNWHLMWFNSDNL